VLSGSSVLTFWDNLSVPSSRVKKSKTLKMGPIGCPETSVLKYHSVLRNIPEERRSHISSSSDFCYTGFKNFKSILQI
jgi:hypothetical protein